MFKKHQNEETAVENNGAGEEELQDTVIAQGVKVEGDFNSKGNVIIEGWVTGSLKTHNNLHVGERAKISASVEATNAFIAGEVAGNVRVKDKLELSPTSRIYGDIEARVLIITAGAILNGKCAMSDPSAPNLKSEKKLKKDEHAESAELEEES